MMGLLKHSILPVLVCASVPLACGDDGRETADGSATNQPVTSIPSNADASAGTVGDSDSVGDTEPTGGTMSGAQTMTGPTNPGESESVSVSSVATDSDSLTDTGPDSLSVSASDTDPACSNFSCSDDLGEVLCDGEFVESCGDGTYCIDGACTPLTACEAAELFKGSEGCEFWAVKTELIGEATGTCFAAFVANMSDQPAHIGVEYNGSVLPVAAFTRIPSGQGQAITYSPYDEVAGLPPNEVAILFLSRAAGGQLVDCPVPAGVPQETHVVGTGRGHAFNITTDQPVAAYQILPYGGGSAAATSATLMLPTSVWDVNYVAINAYQKSQAAAEAEPLFAVVADEDATTVTLDPKVAVVGGGGVAGGPAGTPIVYMMNRGETLQFRQVEELTGSPLIADKRVGVFGGATCLNVPVSEIACDGAHQQIPPIKALGSTYPAVRYRNRAGQEESPPWRLVGVVDNTTLTYMPSKPPGAPDSLSLGQVAEFTSPGQFVVSSQDADHPFYMAAYMTGGLPLNGTGDPEWVNVIPSAQFLDKYVLFTDPTYPETNFVVIRRKVDGAFSDVTLGCAGALGGWQPIDADHEFMRIDLVTGNFQNVGNCSNGRHELTSSGPFGVTVWGWGSTATGGIFLNDPGYSQYVSYAYPAGAGLRAINDVMVIPQ
jgi:hypothetical protein